MKHFSASRVHGTKLSYDEIKRVCQHRNCGTLRASVISGPTSIYLAPVADAIETEDGLLSDDGLSRERANCSNWLLAVLEVF